MSVDIVVYCRKCDYFLRTAVSGPIGTHGCATCDQGMDVFVARGSDRGPDYSHAPPTQPVITTVVDGFTGRTMHVHDGKAYAPNFAGVCHGCFNAPPTQQEDG